MQLRYQQICVFILTWTAYAGTYLMRKPLAVVKTDIANELSMTRTDLGWLDTAMLLPYAAVQVVFGSSADRYGARRVLAYSLITSAMSMASFGLWHSFYVYAILLFINGAAQSQAWPSCVKGLSGWYTAQHRNAIFGMWGTCTFAGGVFGTALVVHLQINYGWRDVFLIPSFLLGCIGMTVLLFLHSPKDYNVTIPGKELERMSSDAEKPYQEPLSLLQLWSLPMVKEVALSMCCIKIVRYSMFMWLPMYLHQQLQYSKAGSGILSTSFEVGGVIGSAMLGYVIQRFLKGRMLLGSGLAMMTSALSLLAFILTAPWGVAFNMFFMGVAGAFNCGVDPIIGGAVPAEIGEVDGQDRQASVSGFVNGFGSLGTVLQGPVVGALTEHYGWSVMLYLIVALSLLATLASVKGHIIRTRMDSYGHSNKHGQLGI